MSTNASRRQNRRTEIRRRKRRTAVVAAVVAAGLMGASVLALTGGEDESPQVAEADGAKAFAHIHGLGVDPSDGMLYAGTHYGTFKVPIGAQPVQVGPTRDYMGFTVVGPNRFLASGHPGIGENAPGSLGLMESTNGGKDWKTLSLRGKADFHSLGSRNGVTYGYSGGVLMASQDGKEWETRSRLSLATFAISPRDPNVLLATTNDGVARSIDGGRTFSPVPGAPALLLLSTANNGITTGATEDGRVFASSDGGTTWEQRGSVDEPPQAMTVTDTAVHVATEGAIYDSTDGGRTFMPRYVIKA